MHNGTISESPPGGEQEVERIFEEHDFNGLPVVDDKNRLIGMITKLDLLKAFTFNKKTKIPPYSSIMNRKAVRVMSKAPRVVHRETPLTRVLQLMVETRHKSFPVVEEDRARGHR